MKQFDWTRLFTRPLKLYTQLIFWIVVASLYILLKEYPEQFSGAAIICNVLQQTLELAIPSYSQNLLVVPFFQKGKWGLGLLFYILQVALLIWLIPFMLNAVGLFFGAVLHVQDRADWQREHISFSIIAFTIVATFFKIGLDRLILDKEQKETELRQLKAQLNPHFLFNTLNNFYGLSVAESKKLPGLMLKLSDLLRYSLYDTHQHYVPLEKELQYISNYVELERIRLSEQTDIVLDMRGDFADRYIAPLLLIIFVENSFKHFFALRNQPGFVHISIVQVNGELQLQTRNSSDPASPLQKTLLKGGLGLTNVRKRLNLIYPQKHSLSIRQESGFFEAELKIDLS